MRRYGDRPGGAVLEGIKNVAKSPQLLGIAAFMLLYTVASTFLCFLTAGPGCSPTSTWR